MDQHKFHSKSNRIGLLLVFLALFACSEDSFEPPSGSAFGIIYPKSTSKVNYLDNSYNLSNPSLWISSDDVLSNGVKYTADNPLLVIQTAQLDINGDGFEDIFTYDTYPLDIPTPNPPPSIFLGNGKRFNKVEWTGPTLKNPHGVKLLVGDFNGDSYPDIFSLVAVDMPNGEFASLQDFNNLLLNSPKGFTQVKEFTDKLGYWYTGCSGDIDNDGDLDIIMFNFHNSNNGVKNQILWNDGKANFTYDVSGIGSIPLVDESELYDVNNDGFLDLVLDHIEFVQNVRSPRLYVLLGNGKGFNLTPTPAVILSSDQFIHDINFADLDSDSIQEIILGGYDGNNSKFWVEVFKSNDKGKSYSNVTSKFFENNIIWKRFDQLRVQDIDKNGKIDIFSPDKSDKIRWEWNGSKFIFK